MLCPTCNRAFPAGNAVCPHDGSLLVPEDQAGGWDAATMAQDDLAEAPPPGQPAPRAGSQPRVQPVRVTPQPRTGQTPAASVVGATGPRPRATGHPAGHAQTGPSRHAAGLGHRTSAVSPSSIREPAGRARPVLSPSPSGTLPPETNPPRAAGPLQPQSVKPADMELPPGTMVGEYQITGLLGTGGMGSVYAGIQPLIGKRVAIKVLLRELAANPQVVARFMQEARAVNQAQSRHIVDIFSFGELPDGRQYFVMEYLEGCSLRQFLKERKTLEFDEAFGILKCVTKGLIAAHSKGIVHRDIKPENIMVKTEEDGARCATVLDFGIAKLQGGDSSQPGFATRTGAAMGTPYYMSPEQCRGVGVDHRTDIYALGIIMFEMFTGALPFSAKSYIDLVNKHLFASPPPPSKLRNNISPVLEALILRCIAKDPSERPQSVEQVLHELQQAAPSLRGTSFNLEPISESVLSQDLVIPPSVVAQRTGPGRPTPSVTANAPPSKNPGLKVGLIAFVVVVLAVGGAVAAFLVYRSGKGPGAGSGSGSVGSGTAPAGSKQSTLRISTRPAGARVFLDGKARPGATPMVITPSAGVHQLRLELAGFRVSNESVTLRAGEEHSVTYVMVATAEPPTSGSLVVSTGLPGAVYFLDEKQVGEGAELSLGDLEPGQHVLRITAAGYAPKQENITVEAGGKSRVELRLQPKRVRPPRKGDKKKQQQDKKGNPEDPDGTLNPFNRR